MLCKDSVYLIKELYEFLKIYFVVGLYSCYAYHGVYLVVSNGLVEQLEHLLQVCGANVTLSFSIKHGESIN